jgi:hypothetical protein
MITQTVIGLLTEIVTTLNLMEQKHKWIGVLIMFIGFITSCSLIWLFNLSGQSIDFKTPALVLKFILASAFLPLGLYLGLLLYGGKNCHSIRR